jgi:hypothetical protein
MLHDEIPDGVIQIKCRSNRNRRDGDADQPIKNGRALHKEVPVSFAGRYFGFWFEINQLRVAVFWLRPFSHRWHVELAIDRP